MPSTYLKVHQILNYNSYDIKYSIFPPETSSWCFLIQSHYLKVFFFLVSSRVVFLRLSFTLSLGLQPLFSGSHLFYLFLFVYLFLVTSIAGVYLQAILATKCFLNSLYVTVVQIFSLSHITCLFRSVILQLIYFIFHHYFAFSKTFYLGIIIDSHEVIRNNTERSYVHFTQFLTMVIS